MKQMKHDDIMFFAGCMAVCLPMAMISCVGFGVHYLFTHETNSLISTLLLALASLLAILYTKYLLRQKKNLIVGDR